MNQTLRTQKPTGKPTRRTASKEVRRQQLITSTINSIAKYGIGGTTMSTVTDDAGLSLGIVNFHFESKQKLFEETLLFLAREHHEHWQTGYKDAGLGAADKLRAIVGAHFHPKICTRKKLAVWFAFYGEAGRRKVYRKLIEDIDAERFEISVQLCEKIAEEGGYHGIPPRQIANMLESLYDGLWLDILTYPGSYSRETAQDHVLAFLASIFPEHFAMPDF
ncbi:TetR family transcriptional regulator C-terminal domain-containing protein [Aestuariivita sp.]|jgi:TetR/AcrR family transcriptional repressor of bet genes|uniref:TetR/AcrR family transcriptional regulator n=1 Tax=Aestuariivita sp. TaxID=1872407 RepID=UPI00216ECE59|nr:TetR family transcriptional regulator C-terminal domain-containing protein [Aestuariivita sp.]MCE8007719.1 TetR family transcriptional regulator [Aestuariivita sp.]